MVNDLLDNEVTAFLRRALRRELDNVPLPDVKNAFLETVADSGKTISEEDALEAARQSDGYPYMVQLVGYYMWQSAQRRGSNVITADDVTTGVSDALLAFDDAVCAPALDGTTSAERLFLTAMAEDSPNPTQVGDIVDRTRRSRSWVSKYRRFSSRISSFDQLGMGGWSLRCRIWGNICSHYRTANKAQKLSTSTLPESS